MKKMLKVLTVILASAAFAGVLLSVAYTQTISDELTLLRRENRSDIVYLRNRVRELESDLKNTILDCWTPSEEESMETEADAEETLPEEDVVVDTEAEIESEEVEESVTIPTHNSPETQVGEHEDTEAPVASYLLTVHNGVIGVLDASGELVREVNVFVMTLPEAEQEALAVGIPAYSEEEMLALLERYE